MGAGHEPTRRIRLAHDPRVAQLGERLRAVSVESQADQPAEQWGFSATAIDEWDHADGITRVVSLKAEPRQLATGGR